MDAPASLRAIIACVAQPLWVVDHAGAIVFANPAALSALGYDDLGEVLGRNSHETIHYKHPDGSPFPAEECTLFRSVLEGVDVRNGQDFFVRRDGSMFAVSFTASPIETATGTGAVIAFSDVEERHRAEQALREREAILAKVAQPVWVVDRAGLFHYANPAALHALGYEDLSELKGKPGHATVHYKYPDGTPFPEEDCPLTRARLTGEPLSDREDWLVRKDGSILRIAFSTAPFDLPDGPGSVTAFTDEEEHLRAEQAARERDIARARASELRLARRRIIEAADAARARLERDLHDGAQQQLVNLALRLRIARGKLPSEPEEAARLLDDTIELAAAATSELRELAAGIHPAILTHLGLGPAVARLAARMHAAGQGARDTGGAVPAPGRGERLLRRVGGSHQRGQALRRDGRDGADRHRRRTPDGRGLRRRSRRRRHAQRNGAVRSGRPRRGARRRADGHERAGGRHDGARGDPAGQQ